jgi:hypothetical protein
MCVPELRIAVYTKPLLQNKGGKVPTGLNSEGTVRKSKSSLPTSERDRKEQKKDILDALFSLP